MGLGRGGEARAVGVVPALGVGQMVNGGARSLKVRTSAGFECAWEVGRAWRWGMFGVWALSSAWLPRGRRCPGGLKTRTALLGPPQSCLRQVGGGQRAQRGSRRSVVVVEGVLLAAEGADVLELAAGPIGTAARRVPPAAGMDEPGVGHHALAIGIALAAPFALPFLPPLPLPLSPFLPFPLGLASGTGVGVPTPLVATATPPLARSRFNALLDRGALASSEGGGVWDLLPFPLPFGWVEA